MNTIFISRLHFFAPAMPVRFDGSRRRGEALPPFGLMLALWLLTTVAGLGQGVSTAVSALPAQYTPGTAFAVTITVNPASAVSAYALEDQPPAGWPVSNITQGGQYDSANNKVKWGLFTDNQARTLSYQVTPPVTATGIVTFQGTANFDGILTVPITGQRQSTNAPSPPTVPVITAQPASATKNQGDTATFTVSATGTAPLSYQWSKDGTALADGLRITGSRTSSLTISNVQPGDAGNYTVQVSNSAGSVTSQVAVLTVTTAPPPNSSTAVSSLPAQYTPGTAMTVSIVVTPASTVSAYAVEDQPPAGWTVGTITQSGQYDSGNNKVKWGLFTDNIARTLSYQVIPPATATGTVSFQGSANFDGLTTTPITGQRQSSYSGSNTVARLMPLFYLRGVAFTVTNVVTPAPSTSAYAVEDQPPPGWVVSNINQNGQFDSGNNKVKWGLFTDSSARTLTYQVTPPLTATNVGTFQGSANFDGLITVAITGQSQIFATNSGPILSLSLYAGITLTGSVGSTYRIDAGEAVPAGTNWITLGTVTLTNRTYLFFDTNPATYPRLFYRAILVP